MTDRPLITHNKVQTRAFAPEEALKRRLAFELMDQMGYLEDGKPRASITWTVHRNGMRGNQAGYDITIERDLTKDTRTLLAGPEGK